MAVTTTRAGCLALLVMAGLGAGLAPAQVTLHYQFKPGEKLPYVMEQKMAMTMVIGGNQVHMNMTQTMNMTWNIASVDKNGNAHMTQKFDRIRLNMDSPMGKVEYDSQNGKVPEGPIGQSIGPIYKALTGAEISLTMSPQGKITDVKIPQKVLDALKNVPGAAAMGEMFSGEGLKNMTSKGGLQLPAGPVKKGDSWNQKMEVKMPFGTMKVDTKNTYQGSVMRGGKTLAEITLQPTVTMEAAPNAPATMKLKDQSAKGNALFDNTVGRLVETRLKQNMTMEISGGGQTFTQEIETTTSLKLAGAAK